VFIHNLQEFIMNGLRSTRCPFSKYPGGIGIGASSTHIQGGNGGEFILYRPSLTIPRSNLYQHLSIWRWGDPLVTITSIDREKREHQCGAANGTDIPTAC